MWKLQEFIQYAIQIIIIRQPNSIPNPVENARTYLLNFLRAYSTILNGMAALFFDHMAMLLLFE